MPQQQAAIAARKVIEDAASEPKIDLLADLAEPLAEYMLLDYEREDWQDSPLIESLARVAALLEAEGRETRRYPYCPPESLRGWAAGWGGVNTEAANLNAAHKPGS